MMPRRGDPFDQMPPGSDQRRCPNGVPPRIGILSCSVIPDDPRVRRQGDLLHEAGWSVVAIGLPGARSPAPAWRCLAIEPEPPPAPAAAPSDREVSSGLRVAAHRAVSRRTVGAQLGVLRQAARLALLHPAVTSRMAKTLARRVTGSAGVRLRDPLVRLLRLKTDRAFVDQLYWGLNSKFQALCELGRAERVDLWLANDWTALPIARRLAAEQGVPFAYDTHELAIEEYAERPGWRWTQRPIIAAIEGDAIRAAGFVSCVSAGISGRLARFHRLRPPPLVVRNMPRYEALPFRPTPDRIEVLYHGVVSRGRGLEASIASVAFWRSDYFFTIRGPGDPDYLAHLAGLAAEHGVADRVIFAPAVPMIELVRAAATADIGLLALPGHSRQNVHALPNKLFEYLMAGLALCITDLPEMAAIVRAHKAGELIPAVSPEAIAAAISRLDRPAIDACKRRALAAARELNWENEGRGFLAACREAVRASAPATRR